MPHPRQPVDARPDPREQPAIDEHHVVLGVVDDVFEVLRREPDVDRVQHPLGDRHGEIKLEVAPVVARERGDTGAGRGTEGVQHGGEAPGVVGHVGVRDPLAASRYNVLVRIESLSTLHDVCDGERPWLHQPVHDVDCSVRVQHRGPPEPRASPVTIATRD